MYYNMDQSQKEAMVAHNQEVGILCEVWSTLRVRLKLLFPVILVCLLMICITIIVYYYHLTTEKDYNHMLLGLGILFSSIPIGIICACGILLFVRFLQSLCDTPNGSISSTTTTAANGRDEPSNSLAEYNIQGNTQKFPTERWFRSRSESEYCSTRMNSYECMEFEHKAARASMNCLRKVIPHQLDSSSETTEFYLRRYGMKELEKHRRVTTSNNTTQLERQTHLPISINNSELQRQRYLSTNGNSLEHERRHYPTSCSSSSDYNGSITDEKEQEHWFKRSMCKRGTSNNRTEVGRQTHLPISINNSELQRQRYLPTNGNSLELERRHYPTSCSSNSDYNGSITDEKEQEHRFKRSMCKRGTSNNRTEVGRQTYLPISINNSELQKQRYQRYLPTNGNSLELERRHYPTSCSSNSDYNGSTTDEKEQEYWFKRSMCKRGTSNNKTEVGRQTHLPISTNSELKRQRYLPTNGNSLEFERQRHYPTSCSSSSNSPDFARYQYNYNDSITDEKEREHWPMNITKPTLHRMRTVESSKRKGRSRSEGNECRPRSYREAIGNVDGNVRRTKSFSRSSIRRPGYAMRNKEIMNYEDPRRMVQEKESMSDIRESGCKQSTKPLET